MAMSGFLMVVSCWRHRLQCIVIVLSFLRLLTLHRLAEGKLDEAYMILIGKNRKLPCL